MTTRIGFSLNILIFKICKRYGGLKYAACMPLPMIMYMYMIFAITKT